MAISCIATSQIWDSSLIIGMNPKVTNKQIIRSHGHSDPDNNDDPDHSR